MRLTEFLRVRCFRSRIEFQSQIHDWCSTAMAMTKCKECGHQISTTAKICPSCGHESKSIRRFLSSFAKELISLAVVLLLIWYLKPYWPERLNALFDSLTGG